MKTIFYLEETASQPGKYMIALKHDEFNCKGTMASYHVLEARVLGLSWPDYLRLARDEGGAELIGKNNWYPMVYFNNDERARAFVALLNAYANAALWGHEHPDFKDHMEILNKYKLEHWINE